MCVANIIWRRIREIHFLSPRKPVRKFGGQNRNFSFRGRNSNFWPYALQTCVATPKWHRFRKIISFGLENGHRGPQGQNCKFPQFLSKFYFQPYYSQTCVATIKWCPSCKIVVITLEILISKLGLNIAIKITRFEVLGPLTNGRLFRCYAYRPRIVRVMMASNFKRTRGIITSTGVTIVRIRIGFHLSGILSVMRNHPRSDRTLLTISTRHFSKIGLYWFKIFPRRFSNSALNITIGSSVHVPIPI